MAHLLSQLFCNMEASSWGQTPVQEGYSTCKAVSIIPHFLLLTCFEMKQVSGPICVNMPILFTCVTVASRTSAFIGRNTTAFRGDGDSKLLASQVR